MDHLIQTKDQVSSLYGGFWNFDVSDFCYMTNRYFPPEQLFSQLQAKARQLITSYPSSNLHISSLVSKLLGVSPSSVVVANGASELISAITGTLFSSVAIPTPTFEEFTNRAKLQGKQVFPFQLSGDFRLDIEKFKDHVRTTGARDVVIVNPNNPTGNLLEKPAVQELLHSLSDIDIVVLDESFLDFAASPEESSLIDEIGHYPNLIVLKSMSKNYGIPGLRLGYALSSNQTFVEKIRAHLPIWNINSFAQYFLELMVDYMGIYRESCIRVRDATQDLYEDLSHIPGLYPYPTEGNFILCRIETPITSSALSDRLFNDHKILINDRGGKSGLGHNFFRVAARTHAENAYLVSSLTGIIPPSNPST